MKEILGTSANPNMSVVIRMERIPEEDLKS